MTPEQVCEVLVKAGVLDEYRHAGLYVLQVAHLTTNPCLSARDVLRDGNVAAAAWVAVKAKHSDYVSIKQCGYSDRSTIVVHKAVKDAAFFTQGTDTAALTTACAMALAEVE